MYHARTRPHESREIDRARTIILRFTNAIFGSVGVITPTDVSPRVHSAFLNRLPGATLPVATIEIGTSVMAASRKFERYIAQCETRTRNYSVELIVKAKTIEIHMIRKGGKSK